MSLELTFKASRVFIRTECLSVHAGTFLVHMVWVSFVTMLLWCGDFLSQTRAAQPPQAALQYCDDVIRNVRLERGLFAPVANFTVQPYQESGWRPDAISSVGAQGLVQFIPAAADWISQLMPGLNDHESFNPAWTIRMLISYNRWLWQRVSAASDCERMAMTLSDYNGGLGWVQRDG